MTTATKPNRASHMIKRPAIPQATPRTPFLTPDRSYTQRQPLPPTRRPRGSRRLAVRCEILVHRLTNRQHEREHRDSQKRDRLGCSVGGNTKHRYCDNFPGRLLFRLLLGAKRQHTQIRRSAAHEEERKRKSNNKNQAAENEVTRAPTFNRKRTQRRANDVENRTADAAQRKIHHRRDIDDAEIKRELGFGHTEVTRHGCEEHSRTIHDHGTRQTGHDNAR